MKVVETALGWEVQPENKDEEVHLHWLVDCLKAFGAFTSVYRDNERSKCSRFIEAPVEAGEPARTFTTKGPIE